MKFFPVVALIAITTVLWVAATTFAAVTIETEQLNPADPNWKFKTIPGPSKSDIATNAKVVLAGNRFEPAGGEGAVLVNGKLPCDSLDLSEEAFLSNGNADGGNIVIGLGQIQPVVAIGSYSWHEWDVDQGSRGPQVYVLYGTAEEHPDFEKPEGWTKIAEVDTRPNKTGEKWNGQHGAFLTAPSGKLGDFRYLLFAIKPTRSPRQSSPAMTNTLFAEIDVHTAATLSKAGDAEVIRSTKVTDVWVVFKTHLDIGYTDRIDEVLKKYRVNMMEGALKVVDASKNLPPEKRFSWTLAGWPLQHVLGPKQDAERKARIEQAVWEGAIVFHAIPFTSHTESNDLEDLVRGLGFSTSLAKEYGRPLPLGAKMTDVPCHSWVLPTLLAHAGVKFLHLGCNDNSGYVRVPPLFWWEGPDGSRILCNYSRVYGSGLMPPKAWPSRNYLAMTMTYDNQGPPSVAQVEELRREAEKYMPDVRVHFGTLDDFARAVIAENPELPVVRADMPDTWIHGWLSMPIEAKAARNFRPLEPALDTLDTQLRTWGLPTGVIAPALAEAYEQSNLFSEHTFGPWGPKGGPWESGIARRNLYGEEWKAAYAQGAYKKYEQGFDDKRAFSHKAAEIIHHELSQRLDLLAKSVKSDSPRIVVYNGLPWKRSGAVELPGQSGKYLFAADVPAGGYKTYPAAQHERSEAILANPPTEIDGPFYHVKFDLKRGGIASLVEKRSGRELVDQSSPYALGQFLHERFDYQHMLDFFLAYDRPGVPGQGAWGGFVKQDPPKDLTYAALTPPTWKMTIERTTIADIATLKAVDTLGLAKGIAIVATFYRDRACVDVEWRVTDKTADPIPEGGWLCFPFAVEEPQFLLGRLGGPIDPAKDVVRGANRHYFCLNSGLSITGKEQTGIGLCPLDSPCVSLGEPGLWKYSLDYTPPKPTVFVNLYNNEWNTNFPEWQGGSWSNRVRFWPTVGENPVENLVMPSWEARLPLLAAAANGPGGKLPAEQAGLSFSRSGVLVTAFGVDPAGNHGTLLRLWDQSGISGKLTVTLPTGLNATQAQPVDLRGEMLGQPISIESSRFSPELKAYAPASFILK